MNDSKNKWFEPLDSLIADRLELLKFGSSLAVGKQEAGQGLQMENHSTYLGKYLLMAQEYLTPEEQEELYRMNALEFSARIRYIYRYFVFVAREINKELP